LKNKKLEFVKMNLSFSEIENLDGRTLRLFSSHSDQKRLVMNLLTQKIYFDDSFQKNIDDEWNILPISEDTVLIKNKYFYICHFPDDNGNISLVKEPKEKYCEWRIGKTGEIYHLTDTNEEKYLWVAADNLHIISDGYLADKWSTTPQKNNISIDNLSSTKEDSYALYITMFIVSIMIIIYIVMCNN
jgi:hypothetical protein